jgi:hypothetical protein
MLLNWIRSEAALGEQPTTPTLDFDGLLPEYVADGAQLYIGSCHCAAVRIAVKTPALSKVEVKEDNCSICVRVSSFIFLPSPQDHYSFPPADWQHSNLPTQGASQHRRQREHKRLCLWSQIQRLSILCDLRLSFIQQPLRSTQGGCGTSAQGETSFREEAARNSTSEPESLTRSGMGYGEHKVF